MRYQVHTKISMVAITVPIAMGRVSEVSEKKLVISEVMMEITIRIRYRVGEHFRPLLAHSSGKRSEKGSI